MTGENRPEPTSVTDPDWETELARGLAADGGAGGVEPELAIARLLLHARTPAELATLREDAVWSEIERGLTPVPWWRRRFVLWGGPAIAAAAAAVVLVVVLKPDEHRAPTGGVADQLEHQFAVLAPAARAEVARDVDGARSRLRGELIAMARAQGGDPSGDQGGAP